MTTAELWAVFFEYLTDEGKRAKIIEIINREEGIAMAVETLSNITQDEIEYERLSNLIKSELDYRTGMFEAERRGLTKGLEEGREEGIEEGKLIIAKNLLAEGSTHEFVQRITGLSLERIKEL
jgi:predicted transposase/invertase (TIGR01784 family)